MQKIKSRLQNYFDLIVHWYSSLGRICGGYKRKKWNPIYPPFFCFHNGLKSIMKQNSDFESYNNNSFLNSWYIVHTSLNHLKKKFKKNNKNTISEQIKTPSSTPPSSSKLQLQSHYPLAAANIIRVSTDFRPQKL